MVYLLIHDTHIILCFGNRMSKNQIFVEDIENSRIDWILHGIQYRQK